MRWYQRLSTKLAAAVVSVVGIIILLIGLLGVTTITYSRLKASAEEKRKALTDNITQDLNIVNSLVDEQVRASMRVLQLEGKSIGDASLAESMQIGDKNVPNLILGKTSQVNNFNLVDRVKELMGGTATLFVKSGNDFVRVSTNVQTADGKRAVGTTLDPQGKAIAELKNGKPFYGVVYILDKPYITGYEPIKNPQGEIIGAWYVGYPLAGLEQIQRRIEQTKILETGFLALVDDKGQVVFKSSHADAAVVKKAVDAKTTANVEGWNVNQTEFKPWNYTLVTAYSEDDPELGGALWRTRVNIVIGDLVVMLFMGALIFFMTRRFMKPLDEAVQAADQIAQGKLNVALASRGSDEIGQMTRSMQSMINYLQEMSDVADKIAEGNMSVQVKPRSKEDRFGTAFKNMLERTLRLVQTQEERDRLQRSIMKLLDEVADVAEGDLTAEAEVTADATGAIADAFNYMIGELRSLISQVKATTMQVDTSATYVQTTTENLMRRSEQQTEKLNELSDALDRMADTLQTVSQNTNSSMRVADTALSSAKQGATAVQNNIAAMNRLRSRVQETSERIKRLGERSQEISSIVKIINDLAQRTSVLALNASIQAAAAGQQGRGFVAVAEEVERLAERSAQASKQIDALTKAIQGETNEALSSMETTVKEVSIGVKLTGEVGVSLNEIEAVTQQLAQISRDIAAQTRGQAEDSVDISASMRNVAAISQATAASMKESATTVNQLALWSQTLRGSVASFRLPEGSEDVELPATQNAANGFGATIGV
jgi:methyl-accepting chemotaxis protein